jgi:signal transduction histidine kinase
MFRNLSAGTKLFVMCTAFVIAVGVPVCALLIEVQIAIDFTRRELVGNRYLATVRESYAAILAPAAHTRGGRSRADVLEALAEAERRDGGGLQTAELGGAVASALQALEAGPPGGKMDARVLSALEKAQMLAQRIGDDSNLTLDPDLDSYYVQFIAVRLMPAFFGRLALLQQAFEESIGPGTASTFDGMRLPILASLLRSTASEIESSIEAAYRGDADGRLRAAMAGAIPALISTMESYMGALNSAATGVDARDATPIGLYHAGTVRSAMQAWALAQSELDRLLLRRIDRLLGRMHLGLALIGSFAGLSIFIAALTHRHIVRPLRRLEAVASTVRQTRDYSVRAEAASRDEIGRLAGAFNDMLFELANARERETAERAEFARVARLTAMGEMAASIAHEVNQPLAAIVASGNAGLRWLTTETPDLGKVQTSLQRVVRDGLRASEVVASVRAMFKREAQDRDPLKVDDLIAEVLAHLQGELQGAQIAVQVEVQRQLPSIRADRVQLQQVLVNLIANGIDAMRSVGDGPRRLRVEARVVEADGVLVAVADSGPGIDPRLADRIFEPFVTGKSSGMGLGLSICRSIVEAHGGRLWVSPASPRGTVFQFLLPVGDA